MCNKKSNVDAAHPQSKRNISVHSSVTDNSTSIYSNSIYQLNSKTSVSSSTSLKEFLPQNPNIYTFADICTATNNLLAKRISANSQAWISTINGKQTVVIQRKFRRKIETWKIREKLSTICRNHHRCVVELLGAAVSGEYIYLVYEYIKGSNLSDLLRNTRNPSFTVLSSWISRMQIAIDLAQGIEYIHHFAGSDMKIIHNHIKSSSVIVTEPDFNAKICHFGTSDLDGEIMEGTTNFDGNSGSSSFGSDKLRRSSSRSKRIEGTKGYMSPEFISSGTLSQKSDVFAFGVVILELLSGQEPIRFQFDQNKNEYKMISLIETARDALNFPGNLIFRKWIDSRLKDVFPVDIARKMTKIAVNCVNVDPEMRPDMNTVAGKISKLYLESRDWSKTQQIPMGISFSMTPR